MELPPPLARLYGPLGFGSPVLYSNFVSSVDGVVTLGATPSAGSVISGRNAADRFLMGLLRAFADAVLIGAGTLRATPGHLWTADHVSPAMSSAFEELRKRLGAVAPAPRLVVVTSTGQVPLSHRAITAGATIVTSSRQASRLVVPEGCDVVEAGEGGPVDMSAALPQLRARGFRTILTEGGPHLMGELVKAGLLDEAFLTISPVLAGRDGEGRLGMVEGTELLPESGVWTRLLSARRHGSFLFLRYSLRD